MTAIVHRAVVLAPALALLVSCAVNPVPTPGEANKAGLGGTSDYAADAASQDPAAADNGATGGAQDAASGGSGSSDTTGAVDAQSPPADVALPGDVSQTTGDAVQSG